MKALIEKRNALLDEMDNIVNTAETETRAFTDEENARFDEIKTEIASLDKTIKAKEEARSMEKMTPAPEVDKEKLEYRAFENYLRNKVETRDDVNMTTTDNGAVIPTSIANKIISKIYEISPLLQMATKYTVGGTINIPLYDESEQSITFAYADEFSDLASTTGKFGSIELKGYLLGALTKVSKSLINNSQFDIVSFVVQKMAEAAARGIEKELINGTSSKITGLSGVSVKVTADSATALTADELIDVQDKVIDAYQGNAIWIMSRATRSAIRKLKDKDGNYLLNRDLSAKWGYTLLGKDVYVSENVPDMEAGKLAIFYGDMSGLAVKISENLSIEVLRELFATQHAIGVVGYVELDAKIENTQKIAALQMAANPSV